MALIESGFAHPAKAEELTAAAMAIDADALLTSCNDAGKDEKTKLTSEEIVVVPGVNTPPDTPDEDSPSPPGRRFN